MSEGRDLHTSDDLTPDACRAAVDRMIEIMSSFGFTTLEFAEAMRKIGEAMRKALGDLSAVPHPFLPDWRGWRPWRCVICGRLPWAEPHRLLKRMRRALHRGASVEQVLSLDPAYETPEVVLREDFPSAEGDSTPEGDSGSGGRWGGS